MLGVPVRLHFTFILLFLFLIVTDNDLRQANSSYVLFLIGLFASVLLHELAHAYVATRFGVRTTEIVMFPIGGLSRLERALKPTEEVWITLAGPAVNLLISGGIFGYMLAMHQSVPINIGDLLHPTDANALARLAYGNLILAAFNLLPAFPWTADAFCGRCFPHSTRGSGHPYRRLDGSHAGHQHGTLRAAVTAVHAGVLRVFHFTLAPHRKAPPPWDAR